MDELLEYIKHEHKTNYNQIAKRLEVSHATILRWQRGSDKPDMKSCIKLAKLTGIPLSFIIFKIYRDII